jgi:hypothetical protein
VLIALIKSLLFVGGCTAATFAIVWLDDKLFWYQKHQPPRWWERDLF